MSPCLTCPAITTGTTVQSVAFRERLQVFVVLKEVIYVSIMLTLHVATKKVREYFNVIGKSKSWLMRFPLLL